MIAPKGVQAKEEWKGLPWSLDLTSHNCSQLLSNNLAAYTKTIPQTVDEKLQIQYKHQKAQL